MVRKQAFTLIELLIVIAIIGVLMSMAAVAASRAILQGQMLDVKNNMKNVVTASVVAESFNNDRMPPAYGKYGQPPAGQTAQRNGTVLVHLLPYLENKPLFDHGSFSTASVKVYLARLDPSLPAATQRYTSLVANLRLYSTTGSRTPYNQPITDLASCLAGNLGSSKVPDGPSNTIYFATKYASCNGVSNYFDLPPHDSGKRGAFFGAGNYAGTQIPMNDVPTGNLSKLPPYQLAPSLTTVGTGVCNNDAAVYGHSYASFGLPVAMGDTSVRVVSMMVTGETFARALSPTDGQPLGSDWE